MRISELLQERMVLSLEVFPPKTDAGMDKLCGKDGSLERFYELRPDYISCTYGAGGSNIGRNLEVLKRIKADGKCIPMTHFNCIRNTKDGIRDQLQTYLDSGVGHVLALRGDLPVDAGGTCGDFHHATELVKFIRREFGDKFDIAVAGSPEGHLHCRSLNADITFLKQKQDNGANFILTQLCWDMEQFKRWYDAIRKAGVTMPVDIGVMPVLDISAVINMSLSRNGCAIPGELARLMSLYWIFPNPFAPKDAEELIAQKKASFRKAGIEYTIRLIDEYRALGVNGIHLYTLNKYEAVSQIVRESGITDII